MCSHKKKQQPSGIIWDAPSMSGIIHTSFNRLRIAFGAFVAGVKRLWPWREVSSDRKHDRTCFTLIPRPPSNLLIRRSRLQKRWQDGAPRNGFQLMNLLPWCPKHQLVLCAFSVTAEPADSRQPKMGRLVPQRPRELLLDRCKMESTVLFIWDGFSGTNLMVSQRSVSLR